MGSKVAVLLALLVVLSLPFVVRSMAGSDALVSKAEPGALKLVIITPHVEQIRDEFSIAFDRWHKRVHGQPVFIDWRTPGGTADIMKQLEASFEAAARNGLIDAAGKAKPGSAGFDLFFGGGSFEHSKMAEEKKAKGSGGEPITYRLGQPAGFDQKQLDEWYGENKIGVQTLYDPKQYWMGTALSGFGIVYNKDTVKELGVAEPRSFRDLCDFRYRNMLALADGRQSGSVTTTYDSIMNKEGWDGGWRTLREMCANARYFATSSTKPPIDVSQGDAAAGLAIDFYGRGQAQALLRPGQDPSTGRVGYIDPEGAVYIDADPCSILNGASNFDLAKRFVEFCLTEEAQALWQFRSKESGAGKDNPIGADGKPMGPERYELRRMPVRRVMYEKYARHFVDATDPFKAASDVKQRGWRSAIPMMMAAFGIDTAPDLREAWYYLNLAREKAKNGAFPTEQLQQMEQLFYAFPSHQPLGLTKPVPFNEANFKQIKDDTKSWKDLEHGKRSIIAYTEFFRRSYREVVRIAKENGL